MFSNPRVSSIYHLISTELKPKHRRPERTTSPHLNNSIIESRTFLAGKFRMHSRPFLITGQSWAFNSIKSLRGKSERESASLAISDRFRLGSGRQCSKVMGLFLTSVLGSGLESHCGISAISIPICTDVINVAPDHNFPQLAYEL